MRRLRLLIAAMASTAVLAACGNGDDDTTVVPDNDPGAGVEDTPLTGTYWQLDGFDVADLSADGPPDTPSAYLTIEDGGVGGNTGCNSFGGDAEVSEDGNTITFSDVFATMRACSGALGETDSAMLRVLNGEVTVEVSGDTLTLTNADGDALQLRATEEPPDVTDEPTDEGSEDPDEDSGDE